MHRIDAIVDGTRAYVRVYSLPRFFCDRKVSVWWNTNNNNNNSSSSSKVVVVCNMRCFYKYIDGHYYSVSLATHLCSWSMEHVALVNVNKLPRCL